MLLLVIALFFGVSHSACYIGRVLLKLPSALHALVLLFLAAACGLAVDLDFKLRCVSYIVFMAHFS